MKRRRRNPRFLPQVAPYDPSTPLIDFENPLTPEGHQTLRTALWIVGGLVVVSGVFGLIAMSMMTSTVQQIAQSSQKQPGQP